MSAHSEILEFCKEYLRDGGCSYYVPDETANFSLDDLDYDMFERYDYDDILDAMAELEREGVLTRYALFECPLCKAKITMRTANSIPSGIYNDDCPACEEPVGDQYGVELRPFFTIRQVPCVDSPADSPRLRNSLLAERI